MRGVFASLVATTTPRGAMADALELLDECEASGLADAQVYDAALATAAVAGAPGAAVALLRRSADEGAPATRKGWDAALRACAKAAPKADVATAALLLEEMGAYAGARSYAAALAAA